MTRAPWKVYDQADLEKIDAPTPIQRAIVYAAVKGGVRLPLEAIQPLIDALRDPLHKITADDRETIADWLQGEFDHPRHRPKNDRRFADPFNLNRFEAVSLYRQIMNERREKRLPVRGYKDTAIAEVARRTRATETQLRNWLAESKKKRR